MTSRVQNARSTVTQQRPPNTRPVGELYVNFADNQLGVIDPTPTARDLLPVRFHAATASYATAAIVQQAGGLYQAKAAIPPRVFTIADWDQFFTSAQNDARYLLLSGGTLTGLLTLSGPPTANLHAATKAYVDAADATKLPLAGGTMTGLLTLSGPPTASLHAATKAYVDSTAGNYLPLAGGTLTGGLVATFLQVSGSGGFMFGDANSSGVQWDGAGWQLRYTRSNGRLGYYRGSDGVELFAIDPSGNGKFAGGNLQLLDGYLGFTTDAGGGVRHIMLGNTWSFDWNGTNGDLVWSGGGSQRFVWRASDSLAYNNIGPVGGLGAYQNLSDARTKQNIQDLSYGMAQVRALRPRQFERIGSSTAEIGFIAQEVQPVVPEATPVMGVPLPDGSGGLNDPNPTLSVTGDALLAVAIAALQSLDQRVTLLENPGP